MRRTFGFSGLTTALAAVAAAVALAVFVVGVATAATPRQAPPTSGLTVTGGKASLQALRGKPVLVNIWSSW